MACYETTFIARQGTSQQAIEGLAKEYGDLVTKNGGKVIKTEHWGLRDLAYRVKKYQKGYYVMLGIEGPYESVQAVENSMRYNEDIIRSLTIKVEELSKEPSFMASKQGDSEEEVKVEKSAKGEE